MSIAAETRNYFGSLIKSLVTNESLEKPLGVFQEKTVKRFEDKLDERNPKIMELESKIAMQENAFQKLEIKCNDNEEHSHRWCIRIHGVKYNEKVERCCDEIVVKFDSNEIDGVHQEYLRRSYFLLEESSFTVIFFFMFTLGVSSFTVIVL